MMDSRVALVIGEMENVKNLLKFTLEQNLVLTDKTIPLEERWENFVALSKAGLLPNKTYGDGYIEDCFDLNIYDDMYIERYETTKYTSILDRLKDNEFDEVTPEALNKWKEKVLDAGYGSFTYDW